MSQLLNAVNQFLTSSKNLFILSTNNFFFYLAKIFQNRNFFFYSRKKKINLSEKDPFKSNINRVLKKNIFSSGLNLDSKKNKTSLKLLRDKLFLNQLRIGKKSELPKIHNTNENKFKSKNYSENEPKIIAAHLIIEGTIAPFNTPVSVKIPVERPFELPLNLSYFDQLSGLSLDNLIPADIISCKRLFHKLQELATQDLSVEEAINYIKTEYVERSNMSKEALIQSLIKQHSFLILSNDSEKNDLLPFIDAVIPILNNFIIEEKKNTQSDNTQIVLFESKKNKTETESSLNKTPFKDVLGSSKIDNDRNLREADPKDKEESTSALEIYGTDITKLAQSGRLDPCFGREAELLEMMEILVRRQKNNPVLIGDAGVGKTAIIELFATKLVNNLVPFVLSGRTIISIDLARIVAGSRYRGEFELRLQKVLDEVMAQPNVIIFIDEIHTLGGAGSAEGSLDAANILKPVLSRSGFQCIGATTTKEYEKIEKDPALNRRFQPIKINEPSVEATVNILYSLRPSFEAFHNVDITPGALQVSAELTSRYIHDRFLPDKAIDLVDRAAAKEVIKLTSVTEGSVISGMVHAALGKIGTLRMEAFRRGDIATEFIFQELENSYRGVLLRWLENPLSIKEDKLKKEKPVESAIAQQLYEKMQKHILKHEDELLFSSPKPRYVTKLIKNISELSPTKNKFIYQELKKDILTQTPSILSVYRISLFLFGTWIHLQKNQTVKEVYFKELKTVFFNQLMYKHLCSVKYNLTVDPLFYSGQNKDFYELDAESSQKTVEVLSELEEKRIETFLEFLKDLNPLLQKGLIQSLSSKSGLDFSKEDLTLVYNLLGYFSTDTGRNFITNTDDEELIRYARKVGDFSGLKSRITEENIRSLLSHMTGIPVESLSDAEAQKLLNLEATLHKRVVGQDEAISAIAKAIKRSRLGIQNPNRPIASFLFCGPTGVGKTEVTKALAISMFGSEKDMIRFDMSEFMEKFAVSRLIGSPPGYVGYDEGGQLTNSVRKKPYSVVLFDEIEKAHPDVLNILLQILEDGRLTDSQKRLVSFENTIIIMTSNAAAEEIQTIMKADRNKKDSEPFIPPIKKKDSDFSISTNNLQNKSTNFNLVSPQNSQLIDSQLIGYENKKNSEFVISSSIQKNKKKKITISEKAFKLKKSIYYDLYSGPIEFMISPIKENYFTDLRKKIQESFKDSYLGLSYLEIVERLLSKDKIKDLEKDSENKNSLDEINKTLKEAVLERLSTMFLPEFLNRLDDIIIFQPLKPDELRGICEIMIKNLSERLKLKNIVLIVNERVKTKLTREGYNPLFGARPLRRLIIKHVEDLVSETLLKHPISKKVREINIILNESDKIIVKE